MQSLFERAFLEPMNRLTGQLADVAAPLVTVTVILIVGGGAAHFLGRGLRWLLAFAGFDRMVGKSGFAAAIEKARVFRSPSDFAARCLEGLLWLFVVLLALNATGTQMMQDLVARFVNYIPDLLTSALVLLLGWVISKFLARSTLLAAVNAQWGGARLLAGAVRVLVMMLAVLVALEQLRIGRTVLLVAFAILFGGIVVAGAIAFGLGARDLAREWMQSKLRPTQGDQAEEAFRHL